MISSFESWGEGLAREVMGEEGGEGRIPERMPPLRCVWGGGGCEGIEEARPQRMTDEVRGVWVEGEAVRTAPRHGAGERRALV